MSIRDTLAKSECGSTLSPTTIDLKTQLTYQRKQIAEQVERLDELLRLLDQHPEVNRILELLGQNRGF